MSSLSLVFEGFKGGRVKVPLISRSWSYPKSEMLCLYNVLIGVTLVTYDFLRGGLGQLLPNFSRPWTHFPVKIKL